MKHSYLGLNDDITAGEQRILENEEELERNSTEADNKLRATIEDLQATQADLTQAQKDIEAIPAGSVDNAAKLANQEPAYYLDRTNHTGTQPASTISDLTSAIEGDTQVAANTAARHTHANKTLLDTYTQAEADLADAVAKKHTHANKTQLDAITDAGSGAIITDTERTKLNGIEDGATADQTPAEIKTAYESNADTNAYTDAEKTKLLGIEATADVTATHKAADTAAIQGVAVDNTTAPADGEALVYNAANSQYEPAAVGGADGGAIYDSGLGVMIFGTGGGTSGVYDSGLGVIVFQ